MLQAVQRVNHRGGALVLPVVAGAFQQLSRGSTIEIQNRLGRGNPPRLFERQQQSQVIQALAATEASTMAKSAKSEGQSNLMQTILLSVITVLLGLVTAMVAFYAQGFREDVTAVRADVAAIRSSVADTKLELTKEISNLGGKLDVLNQKVEDTKPHK